MVCSSEGTPRRIRPDEHKSYPQTRHQAYRNLAYEGGDSCCCNYHTSYFSELIMITLTEEEQAQVDHLEVMHKQMDLEPNSDEERDHVRIMGSNGMIS